MPYITCLNAFVIAGNPIINENYLEKSQQPDAVKLAKIFLNLDKIGWSSIGDLKYLKGMAGSKILDADILSCVGK